MRRSTLYLILGGSGLFLVILLGLVGYLLLQAASAREEAADSMSALDEARQRVAADVDPFADREADAVRRVRQHRVSGPDGEVRIQDRIAEGVLGNHLPWMAVVEEDPQWTAIRVEDTSIYQVTWRHEVDGLHFGPRWYVQVDAEGPRPEGSGGVLPMNALAELIHAENPRALARYMNRESEVIEALTNHRFDGGMRLASALLVHFGRTASLDAVRGWVVVPERIQPPDTLIYLAHFQWGDDDAQREATWEVDLHAGRFQPANLRAFEMMRSVRGYRADDVQPLRLPRLRGREMDLSLAPRAEGEEDLRALRWLLADERLREAVATLLESERAEHRIEDRGWRIRSAGAARSWMIHYDYLREGEEREIVWRVHADSGAVVPSSDISRLAALALQPRGAVERAP